MTARIDNERKFTNWEELPDKGRKYWLDIVGRLGWRARYVKIVDSEEKTFFFRRFITRKENWLRHTKNSLRIKVIRKQREDEP
jgi:hypothetical protein